MLYISLREGDYVMIGDNIRVSYDHMNGKDGLVLGFDAPKDVAILRGKLYEEEIERMAESGDADAMALSAKLRAEFEKRRAVYEKRRQARDKQQARIDAGEIKDYARTEKART